MYIENLFFQTAELQQMLQLLTELSTHRGTRGSEAVGCAEYKQTCHQHAEFFLYGLEQGKLERMLINVFSTLAEGVFVL